MTIAGLLAPLTRKPEVGLGVALGLGALLGSGAIRIPSLRLPAAPAAPAAPVPPPRAPAGAQATSALPAPDGY